MNFFQTNALSSYGVRSAIRIFIISDISTLQALLSELAMKLWLHKHDKGVGLCVGRSSSRVGLR